ncbi:hypothetical protein J2S05_001775 [Alkalicoccobacillus murimartini]|uniref:Uncharacterized protein n=1 Tax=Alkalicoccobacillus murimartini TaxID=171685 RepID=A0ABT9YGI6_9BACI|nr:hypothetical protein [Alkalicoccobacillus murimartini]
MGTIFFYQLNFKNGISYFYKSKVYLESPHRIIQHAVANGFMYKDDKQLVVTARRVRSDQVIEPVKLV